MLSRVHWHGNKFSIRYSSLEFKAMINHIYVAPYGFHFRRCNNDNNMDFMHFPVEKPFLDPRGRLFIAKFCCWRFQRGSHKYSIKLNYCRWNGFFSPFSLRQMRFSDNGCISENLIFMFIFLCLETVFFHNISLNNFPCCP